MKLEIARKAEESKEAENDAKESEQEKTKKKKRAQKVLTGETRGMAIKAGREMVKATESSEGHQWVTKRGQQGARRQLAPETCKTSSFYS